MSDDSIKGIQGIGKKQVASEAAAVSHLGGVGKPRQAEVAGRAAQGQGDRVQFSDEIREPEQGKPLNLDALKENIAGIKEKIGAKPSGEDATSGLINDAFTVQMERNGLGGAKPPVEGLGLNPGMNGGSTFGSGGVQEGLDPGMKSGGVFSSRRTNTEGYQPGGDTASPDMVKMQVNYAKALKNGDHISPEGEGMVLQNLADSGKGDKPIKALLGMG